jgi:hypothetical protein
MRFHPLIAAILGAAANLVFGALPSAPRPAPKFNRIGGGRGSVNHAARAARSHAGKPAGYVKAY